MIPAEIHAWQKLCVDLDLADGMELLMPGTSPSETAQVSRSQLVTENGCLPFAYPVHKPQA